MTPPDRHRTFRIRDVVVDLAAYEVRRDGRPVRLERQPMDLLILLVERRGQLVTRAEIVDVLWGKDVFVDVETGIHTAIRKIRQALHDPADAPVFIETVPGKGYRFIGPVEELSGQATASVMVEPRPAVDDAPAALPVEVAEPVAASRAGWARRVWVVAAILLASAALASVAGWSWRRSGEPGVAGRVVIAVLPFENISRDADNDYLADGLAEDTIVSLGRIDPDRVSVIGRTTMLAYRGTRKSLAEIGRELGADYLVESSLRAESESVRITSRLVRAIDQVQIWSESFDKTRGNVLSVQQELSRHIAEQVRATLSPARHLALGRRHSRNEEALDYFLRGRAAFYVRTPAAMRQAVAAFRQATEADPEYALAWAGLATAQASRVLNSDADPREVLPLAREAAMHAARIDPDLPEAQHAVAYLRWVLEWNWPAAAAGFHRALELDPSYGLAHQALGHLLSQMGRHAEGAAELQRARELDPLDPVRAAISSQVAFQAQDPRTAALHAERAIELNPGFWFGYQMLGQAREQLGQHEASLKAALRAMELSGRNSKPVGLYGYTLARAGRTAEARALLASLEQRSREQYVPPYTMALIHAGLDDQAAVFDWLERAYAVRDVHLMYLPVDPKWDPYRADRRFVALLARCRFAAP